MMIMANQTSKKKAAPGKKAQPASRTKTATKKQTTKKQPSATAAKPKPKQAAEKAKQNNESRILPGLMQGLQSVFDKIHKDSREREDHQEKIIEEFSDRLTQAFEQSHSDTEEKEKLLLERLEAIEKEQSYRIQRIKLFSLPGTLIAVAALIYLFYVVHIMERSMTSMSADMNQIRHHIASIGNDTHTMSGGVTQMNQHMAQTNENMQAITSQVEGMNGNMNHLTRNVGVMTHDVGAMSHTVSPVMNGMRKFVPMF
jgi:tape measure domain-containing protein